MKAEAQQFADRVLGRLRSDPEGVCRFLLPAGRRAGSEWEVDSLAGEPGDNLKVQLAPAERALEWKDFEKGDGGGVWKLWMGVRSVSWWEAVCQAADWAGLAVPEIRSQRERASGGGGGLGRILRVYDYVDLEGRLLHQTVRFEPKEFRQRRPAVEGQREGQKTAKRDRDGRWWLWTLKGIEPVLYRWPEVAAAAEVWVTEGEKDADALRSMGAVATTCPMGAKKWRRSYTEALRGRRVVLCGDSDEAGVGHLMSVGDALRAAGLDVAVADWEAALGRAPEVKTDAARFLNYVEQ